MQVAKWIIAVIAVFNFGGLVADALVPATAKQQILESALASSCQIS